MQINESGEMYLEILLKLECEDKKVRSIDVANELNYSRSSVNKAMNILKEKGYITQQPYGAIYLTSSGRNKAKGIYEKHKCIKKFLEKALNIDSQIAESDACKIEHIISNETFKAIKKYNK